MDVDHDECEGEGTHLEPMDIDHDKCEGEDVVNNTQPENYMIVDDDKAGGEDAMEVCDSITENSAQPEYMDVDDIDVEMHAHSDDMDIDM